MLPSSKVVVVPLPLVVAKLLMMLVMGLLLGLDSARFGSLSGVLLLLMLLPMRVVPLPMALQLGLYPQLGLYL